MKSLIVHGLAAAIIAGSLWLAYYAPEVYDPLMEEDRTVEWGTVALYLAAAAARGYHAMRTRRVFDGLVAVFCLFVAGEEVSWGQRLIGYTPPAVFLERNTQQEANVHNFADVFGRPKWLLVAVLAGYGALLPALARAAPTRRLIDRVGATAPSASLAPWFLAAVAILIWYPVTFTGEWVELLSGWLFVAAAPISPNAAALTAAAAIPVSLGMTGVSAMHRQPADSAAVGCARAEAAALLEDLLRGGAATPDLDEMSTVHKRVWSSIASGFVDARLLRQFRDARCGGGAGSPVAVGTRRRYAVDPWGTAYWLYVGRPDDAGGRRYVVYSFGPNRRRDGEPGETTGDDIEAEGVQR